MSSKDGFELKHKKSNTKAILLYHGLTGSPFEMRQYAKVLYRAGYDVYCPCLPGHAGTIQEFKKIKWTEWKEFAINKFDELKNTYEEVFLGGLCMGAALCVAVAEERQNVAGIAALSTTLYLDGWKMPWYKFLFPIGIHTMLKFFYDFPDQEPFGIKNEVLRRKISGLIESNTVAFDCVPMVGIVELLRLSKHVRKNIKKANAPILLIHAKDDDQTSVKGAKFVYKNISSKNKELIILYDSYHLITIDNEKDFVASKSVEFFNSISTSNGVDLSEDKIVSTVEQ